MIGQIVHATNSPRPWQIICLLMSLVMFGVAAVTTVWHLAFMAVVPFFWALIFWIRRPRSCSLVIEESGFRLLERSESIAYESIQRILINGQIPSGTVTDQKGEIAICFDSNRCIRLPGTLTVPREEFISFLQKKLPMRQFNIPHVLADYHNEAVQKFGDNLVTVFEQNEQGIHNLNRNRFDTGCMVSISISLTWIIGGVVTSPLGDFAGWSILGSIVLVFTAVFAAASRMSIQNRLKDCSIITSPKGLALSQGDFLGALQWDELLNCKMLRNKSLRLFVTGSHLDVLNVYDRSTLELQFIAEKAIGHR